ncbi:ankyrin repeat domain-containing protein [Paenibacillus sp. PR3]|uniref:Ankyrin repeat domain-containing protein n=1 Tax=Paenibacillus terricola TaxID=2763503 RepID=A0ABR8N127_9BACL|nr:ankyrin repeat domain-containing protein [Paenibacillus terricola]MBD3921890.1 ankyrin repeat domain-containing protein [Paenibacillus terricola]
MDEPSLGASPIFRQALEAIDRGEAARLERLLAEHPALVQERADTGEEGYFHRPYLLWFTAHNPIRGCGYVPSNTDEMIRLIIAAAERKQLHSLQEQLDYTLMLVSSGCAARQCGMQHKLIGALLDAHADPQAALLPALAHRETAAVRQLLARGAALTLPIAAAIGPLDECERLIAKADANERQHALAAAALYGNAPALALLIAAGVDLNAYSPASFHPHATALHHAVDSGSLEAVRLLVEAGSDPCAPDKLFGGTPLGWADHIGRQEITAYLRSLK